VVEALRVVRARDRAVVLAALRFGLGLAALAVAMIRVQGDRVMLGLALGALAFATLGTMRQHALGKVEVEDGLPPGAAVEAPVRSALGLLYPSSTGVFVLALAAVPVEPLIAPVLAGVLVGMAIATAASAGQLTAVESSRRIRVYASVRPPRRAFAESPSGRGA
jgi:hypothetical protein